MFLVGVYLHDNNNNNVGFWWAFISMTTVGYGDKIPTSVCARLFSIIWIMFGVIGFGILTGQLTGEIVKANAPPPPLMKGKVCMYTQINNFL